MRVKQKKRQQLLSQSRFNNLTDGKAAATSSSTGRACTEKGVTQYRSDLDD